LYLYLRYIFAMCLYQYVRYIEKVSYPALHISMLYLHFIST